MSFESPFLDPLAWNFGVAEVTVPDGLRYAGYRARALVATAAAATRVKSPADAVARRVTATHEVVELETLPFLHRQTMLALPWGLPTFYLFFPSGTSLLPGEHEAVDAGEDLTAAPGVTSVTLAAVFPDRMVREPLLWVGKVADALGNAGTWQGFADRVAAETGGGAEAPVLVLDHAGEPVSTASFEVEVGSAAHAVDLLAVDGGDLQRAIARLNAGGQSIPFLFSQPGPAIVRPLPASSDVQLTRLEDLLAATGQIAVTPGARHVSFTDLGSWFAPQFVDDPAVPHRLRRYHRGNRVKPLVNGPEFFADIFAEANRAGFAGGGVHLGAGFALEHRAKLTKKLASDPDFANTFLDVVERIHAGGGKSRILVPDFIQIADLDELSAEETLVYLGLVELAIVIDMLATHFPGLKDFRTDGSGLVIMGLILLASPFVIDHLLGDGAIKAEPAAAAASDLSAAGGTRCFFSELPATKEDNPLAAADSDFPFSQVFDVMRKFGLYHQKIAVVWTPDGPVGYCGGMDLNTNRLDDAHHLASYPYHDVHARLDGPAVRDLAITFQQRWERDAGDTDLVEDWPADPAAEPPIPAAGEDLVQIARTYFAPVDPARALEFAPAGDRTILDSLIRAVRQAREYIHIEDQYLTPPEELVVELENRVANGLKKLVLTTAVENGQPFGELVTDDIVGRLRAADPTGDVVRVGLIRRRYTVPASGLRVSSGRLRLEKDLDLSTGANVAVHLSPAPRVPAPPFWLAVDGELMYVYDEAVPLEPPAENVKAMAVERGAGTRLLSSHTGPAGPTVREHKLGAAATVVALDVVYDHAKLLLVDDVFASIGSANFNRRGFYHDAECNLITMPERLRKAPSNPVRHLRKRLWAEMFDLPFEIAEPLLDDPLSASRLFDRSWYLGNRWVAIDAVPSHLMFGSFSGGDGWVMNLLKAAGFTVSATGDTHRKLFDSITDPTSPLDPFAAP